MNIKDYWYLARSSLPSDQSPTALVEHTGPSELMRRLNVGQAVLLGSWSESEQLGHVGALGVCIERTPSLARIEWREVDLKLKPNPTGRVHWRTKAFFGFADGVIDRYGLADLFAERFPDLESITFSQRLNLRAEDRTHSTWATPGFVYLIRSPYGLKIGKTINMKSRTRLFEVKLPFPISVEHYAWFENYSLAESTFHEQFKHKRLEGEWFDLDASDIAAIKATGHPGHGHIGALI
jgi:hypothetical protein